MKLGRRRYKNGVIAVCVCLVIFLAAFLAVVMTRDLPKVEAEITYSQEAKPLTIAELATGQAAIGSNSEVKAIYGEDNAAPTASMAKVITSLVALQNSDDLDKVITLDGVDEEFYNHAVRVNGSRLQVVAGEQLTLRQMHEAMLIVSANNIADSLVYHLFGGQDGYRAAAENWFRQNGLEKTKIGADASGLDSGTVSSPSDMIKIGQIALENSTIRQIVKMKTASFPLESEVENTNKLLNDGYFGIKTGNTIEAGSCLLFATQYENEDVIGVLMGQPFNSTFDAAKMLVEQVKNNFVDINISADTTVGKYVLEWGEEVDIVTTQEVNGRTWGGTEVAIEVKPYQLNTINQAVGSLSLAGKTTNLETKNPVAGPSLLWRLMNLEKLVW